MKTTKLTIYEMAKKAGVSIATISRALNPETRGKVAPATLRRIETLVARHGFTPHQAARHLSRSRTKIVGVLVPHHAGIFLEAYYTEILAGVSDALLDTDYQVKLVMLKCEKPRWDRHDFHAGEGVDGLIVTHWHAFFSDKSAFRHLGVPVAVISDAEDRVPAFFVSGDHEQGGRLAAEYLYDLGHRRVGILTGPADSTDSRLRLKGFRDFYAGKGIRIPADAAVSGEFQEALGAEAAADLLRRHPRLTALFSCNDAMAFGAIRRLKELGISCPGKISVVGYDDEPRAASFEPALSSIRVPVYELAFEAANRIEARLKGGGNEAWAGSKLMPVRLEARASARRAG